MRYSENHDTAGIQIIKMVSGMEAGAQICTAGTLSTSHSTDTTLPTMSLNSAPGSEDRMRVAIVGASAVNKLIVKMVETHKSFKVVFNFSWSAKLDNHLGENKVFFLKKICLPHRCLYSAANS